MIPPRIRRGAAVALAPLAVLAMVGACERGDPPTPIITASPTPTGSPTPTSAATTAAPASAPVRTVWLQRDGGVYRVDVASGASTRLYDADLPAHRAGDAVFVATDEGLTARDVQSGRVLGAVADARSAVASGGRVVWGVIASDGEEGCGSRTDLLTSVPAQSTVPRRTASVPGAARVVGLIDRDVVVQTLTAGDACDPKDIERLAADATTTTTVVRGAELVALVQSPDVRPLLWTRVVQGLAAAPGEEAGQGPLVVYDESGTERHRLPLPGAAAAGTGESAALTAYTQVTVRQPGSVTPEARTDELRIATGLPRAEDDVESRFTVVADLQWSLDGRHVVFTATDPAQLSRRLVGSCEVRPLRCELTGVAAPAEDPTFALLAAI